MRALRPGAGNRSARAGRRESPPGAHIARGTRSRAYGLAGSRWVRWVRWCAGQEWLAERLGVHPSAGWHMDPFGNSAISPLLFDGYGFDSHVVSAGAYADRAAWDRGLVLVSG